MNRHVVGGALMLGATVLVACAPVRTARETAQVVRQTVDEYDATFAATQEAEKKFYGEMATAIQEARVIELMTTLNSERLLQAKEAVDYFAARPDERVTKTQLFELLLKATNAEQALHARLREQAETARSGLLNQMEAFAKRNKEIDAVRKGLDELSKEPSALESAEALFGVARGGAKK